MAISLLSFFLLPLYKTTLRARVASLARDVSGLEAIVLNLDRYRRHVERLAHQLGVLVYDTAHDRPFVSPNGPPELFNPSLLTTVYPNNMSHCGEYQ